MCCRCFQLALQAKTKANISCHLEAAKLFAGEDRRVNEKDRISILR